MCLKQIKNYGTMPFDMMPCFLFPKQQIRSCGVSTEVNILTTKLFLQPLRLALRATSLIYGVNFYTVEAGCANYMFVLFFDYYAFFDDEVSVKRALACHNYRVALLCALVEFKSFDLLELGIGIGSGDLGEGVPDGSFNGVAGGFLHYIKRLCIGVEGEKL